MYSAFQLAKKYFSYYFKADNGKGHGVHSPFVFDFIIHVLNDKTKYPEYKKIEKLRTQVLNNSTIIEVEDFGAGSAVFASKSRAIKNIARSSLKSKKYAQLLFRIAKYYNRKKIVELGTSLGITTCYLASASDASNVYSFEGSKNIASVARQNFLNAELKNIEITEGDFELSVPQAVEKISNPDLIFIDGNHRKQPTLNYFHAFLQKSNSETIFIFDDIHWSSEMEDAWIEIKQHPSVTLTVDLFFIGLVFLKTDFKIKQHFAVRF